MTPPEPPRPDPELHDEDLAALYRQAAREEPSPRHDAAILAAAAAELARPADNARSRPGWWQRWRVGLSLAATVLLSAGLVLLVGREQARDAASPAPATESAAPARDSVQKSAPQSAQESAQDAAREALRSEPSQEKRQAPTAPPASPPARPAESRRDTPAPATPSRQEASPRREADNYAVPAAPAAKAKAEAPAASAPAAPAPFPAPGEARRDAERPAAGNLAREAAEPTPEAQLAEVRALRQAGREEEARTALAAFLRRHPNYPLPADLEALGPPPR